MTSEMSVQRYINNDSIQSRINKLLDKRSGQFTTSLLAAVNANDRLAHCKPETVLNAALTAASLNLPINQNLGFAALVPYGNECQFQLMVKGFIQLAQRSGRYRTISATPVYEGQLVSNDPLRGINFDWSIKSEGDPVGYVAFFELLNGFEKTLFMTTEDVTAHGKRYSKTFSNGPWRDNFEAMALKTVLKLLISRFGPLSTEMETAMESDQAVITDTGRKYVDADPDLEDVHATDEKRAAILKANGVTDENNGQDGQQDNGADDSSVSGHSSGSGREGDEEEQTTLVNTPKAKPKKSSPGDR